MAIIKVSPQPYRIIVSTQKKILQYVMIRLVFCFVKQMKTTVNFQNLLRTMEHMWWVYRVYKKNATT